jgi:hypothetical protein
MVRMEVQDIAQRFLEFLRTKGIRITFPVLSSVTLEFDEFIAVTAETEREYITEFSQEYMRNYWSRGD